MPIAPSPANKTYAFGVGFIVAVVVQELFRAFLAAAIGPATEFFSSRTLALAVLLLVPPAISVLLVRIQEGSVMEDALHGFQVGSIAWLIAILGEVYF